MKLSRSAGSPRRAPFASWGAKRALFWRAAIALLAVAAAGAVVSARAQLPSWMRYVEARSALEAALFRMMSLPGGPTLGRRPPRETRPALSELIQKQPSDAELYSLRALEDEQQLDFSAAEDDWKLYVQHAADKPAANLSLADFYHRRLRPADEIQALSAVAQAPPAPAEKLIPVTSQRSWSAFERIFTVIQQQALPQDVSVAQYRAWIARYPREASLYTRFFQYLLKQKDYPAAAALIADYRKAFAADAIFPVKAQALLEYDRGSVEKGLAVYEQSFELLWPPELVQGYFELLKQTRTLRRFRDRLRAELASNPAGLDATVRLFYYYQQEGNLEAARQAITDFRLAKDAARSPWTANELYVCARLLDDIHSYPEAARFYFALYNSKPGVPGAPAVGALGLKEADGPERALAGLADILLAAPEQPIRFGAGDLSLYRDIATLDQGPGFLNGILSLILNTTAPARRFSEAETRAVPYFHRARAAELLAILDQRFPNSKRRSALHAKLIQFYAHAGQADAVIREGRAFQAAFPAASERTDVALLMADAFARTGNTQEEFGIYDAVLRELAAASDQVPLGEHAGAPAEPQRIRAEEPPEPEATEEEEGEEAPPARRIRPQQPSKAFNLGQTTAAIPTGARSPEYARVLERYLARLVSLKQINEAIAVLRREIDRNPNDPGIYQRLATFLDQNQLGADQEEVYRRAITQFQSPSWYDKLARFYIRHQRDAEFEKLTQEVVKIFKGTDLERYFSDVVTGRSPALYLRVNQYANERFPHDPVFVHNLLQAYSRRETLNWQAWQALLRAHWAEDDRLRNQFFEFLSRNGKLETELAALRNSPQAQDRQWPELARENPLAAQFVAAGELWLSHFESAAPVLRALATEYPADFDLGRRASAVYRSMAYFDPAATNVAVAIEKNLLTAQPASTETLARIGDIYADRDRFADAAPYWDRIPLVAPGNSAGYVEAATIYWDYFDFPNALRLVREGRRKLATPDFAAYEAGAIHEGQRDYPSAVAEYVRAVLASGGNGAALNRLVQLANRPHTKALVDEATAKVVEDPGPAMPALMLRIAVLEGSKRSADVAPLLDSLLERTTSLEFAEQIESLAQQKSLDLVRRHALEKQAGLTADPITRLELRYALVQLYESRNDLAAAQRNVEELYRDNPRILGVVRATVDFYWRNKQQQAALDVLRQAAAAAYPELAAKFNYETARKATEMRQFQLARALLGSLLQKDPYNPEYLAAMAETYAQAGDDPGLRQFYSSEIDLFRRAALPADERKARIATLRRGLIPALTRLKEDSAAVDQYIELINSYPEDDGLAGEAALYAARHDRGPQLTAFYEKAVADSPRDYRWPMVLARIRTNLEDFPGAIDAYSKAITVRPDRVDLRTARASLLERLVRFDEAAAEYQRLYELAYKDPRWMTKVAEIRARQGRTEAAVEALRAALLVGRPETPAAYFEGARLLESWGMLEPARQFVEQGVKLTGTDLLAFNEFHAGARLYARILTRLRRQDVAFARLQQAVADAGSALPVVAQQVVKQGVAGIADAEARRRTITIRKQNAQDGLAGALRGMGDTAQRYFTPEEKVAFSRFLAGKEPAMSPANAAAYLLPITETAGFGDLEARLRTKFMMAHHHDAAHASALIRLQTQRMKFAELGAALEQYAATQTPEQRTQTLTAAAEAYRAQEDKDSELRVLGALLNSAGFSESARYFELLLEKRPQELVTLAARRDGFGESAANYVVANDGAPLAHAAVNAYGTGRPPVWSKAYNALLGLYFSEATPEVNSAFLGALGDATIAERIGKPGAPAAPAVGAVGWKPVDRNQQLAGDLWFYYGGRYGEYLGVTHQGDAEVYLPAMLEQAPGHPDAYATVAEYYADAGQVADAIREYQHTIELDPRRPDIHDRIAVLQFKAGNRAEAIAEWRAAFAGLLRDVNMVRVPDRFWPAFVSAADHLRTRKLFTELQPDVETVLRTYVRKNGNYRSEELLHAAYAAAGADAAATQWLLGLVSSSRNAVAILEEIIEQVPVPQREPLYRRIIEEKQRAAAGSMQPWARGEVVAWQLRFARYLIDQKQFDRAQQLLDALPQDVRRSPEQFVPVQLLLAAKTGKLDSLLAGYRAEPQNAPSAEVLRGAASELAKAGEQQSSRRVLEFVFTREIEEHQLGPANLLGLAEIRLDAGDLPGAMQLLRRLVLVVGEPFANLDSAAALLEKKHRPAEAAEFLDQLVRAAPWDAQARVRLARARLAASQPAQDARAALAAVASSAQVQYDLRAQAAAALAGAVPAELGSGELKLLAAGPSALTPAAADQPFYSRARLSSARAAAADARLALLSNAIADYPRREAIRIPLFRAAAALDRNEFAWAAVSPIINRGGLYSYQVDDEQTAFRQRFYRAPEDTDLPGAPLPAETVRLTRDERIALAIDVANVMAKLGQTERAVGYLVAALNLDPPAATRRSITGRRDELQAILRRKEQNTQRRPVIHAALEQDRLVRPQLVARAAPSPPAKRAPAKGGAQ